MKKIIRKVGVVAGLACMMALSMTGCDKKKKTECAECGEKKTCTKYEFSMMGEDGEDWFCEDCVDYCKGLCESMGGTFKKK